MQILHLGRGGGVLYYHITMEFLICRLQCVSHTVILFWLSRGKVETRQDYLKII